MRKNRGRLHFLVFFSYASVSVLATAIIMLAGAAAVHAGVALVRLGIGLGQSYQFTAILSDSACFALMSAATALTQYYLTSLLSLYYCGKPAMAKALGACALLCGLFFGRAAQLSSLGAYGISGLPIILAVIIGGGTAIAQKPEENPWRKP